MLLYLVAVTRNFTDMINTTGRTHLWHRFFKMTQSSLTLIAIAKKQEKGLSIGCIRKITSDKKQNLLTTIFIHCWHNVNPVKMLLYLVAVTRNFTDMINTTGWTHLWHRFFKMTQSSLTLIAIAKKQEKGLSIGCIRKITSDKKQNLLTTRSTLFDEIYVGLKMSRWIN